MADILLIDDDDETASAICAVLEQEAHRVVRANNGLDGLRLVRDRRRGLLIIAHRPPALDGLGILRALRAARDHSPVIIVSNLDKVDDRVRGLRSGADDYLCRSVEAEELLARTAALLRRCRTHAQNEILRCRDLFIDRRGRQASRAGMYLSLHPREFDILEFLALNVGEVITRVMLLEAVWKLSVEPEANLVDTYISRIRTKIDLPSGPSIIQTVRGHGYMISETAEPIARSS